MKHTGASSATRPARTLSVSGLLHALLPASWLAVAWCALWQNFSLPFIAFGLVLAVGIMLVFPLPTLYLSNRINPLYCLLFAVILLGNIARASFQLLWLAFTFRKPLRNSIVAVQLRTQSDLLLTAVAHTMSVIPGSVVVEVDRSLNVLYFHVLNTSTQEDIDSFTREVERFETLIIKAAGSREEYRAIQAEEAARNRKETA